MLMNAFYQQCKFIQLWPDIYVW